MNERDLIQKWMTWKEESEQQPFSQKTLAESAGISPTYLSSIMTGIRNAGTKTVERIAGAFGTTLAGFYSGPPEKDLSLAGPVRPELPPDAPDQRLSVPTVERPVPASGASPGAGGESPDMTGLKLFHSSPDEIERLFGSFGYPLRDAAPAIPPGAVLPLEEDPFATPPSGFSEDIPLLSRVPEGHWREWPDAGADHVFRRIPPPLAGRRLFGVPVADDGMSPVLERGALVLVDPDHSASGLGGGIAVVAYRGGFRVRRAYAAGELLLLVPANPAWPPEIIPVSEARVFAAALIIPEGMERR